MKILFVHPDLRAGAAREPRLQAAVESLRARGAAVLLSAGVADAFQVLQFHGRSIDLAIIHREGGGGAGEPGIALIRQIRAVPVQQDLPLIVSTQAWSDAECAVHQNSPEGAHAYFLIPPTRSWTPEELCSLVNAVTGGQLDEALQQRKQRLRELEASVGAPAKAVAREPAPAAIELESATQKETLGSGTTLVPINELSEAFRSQSGGTRAGLSIQLELPPSDAHDPSVVLAAPAPAAEPEVAVTLPVLEAAAAPSPILEVETASPPLKLSSGDLPLDPAPEFEHVPLTTSLAPAGEGLPLEFPVVPDSDAPALVSESMEESASSGSSGIEPALEEVPDSEVASQFPYLFSGSKSRFGTAAVERGTRWESLPPVGDAIVPGGASQSPDTEILKKYLALREEDVAALTRQLKLASERNHALEQELAVEKARAAELSHLNDSQGQRISGFERETAVLMESRDREIAELSLQVKTKNDRLRLLEVELKEAKDDGERMRDRVRADLRRIRLREKELENRVEVMKRDQDALLASRESRLSELKRRTDLLEFNNELLSEQLTQERKVQEQLRNQLARVAQAVRAAGGLLQVDENTSESPPAGAAPDGDGAPASLSLDTQSRHNRVAS